jgi:hemoglobin
MTDIKKDIQTIEDVKLMVHTFYSNVQKDQLLGPIFEERLKNKWNEHLEKMVRFWETILLGQHTYHGAPFPPHAIMPINETHFVAWTALFSNTVNHLFAGPIATEAKNRGALMAAIFNSKLEYFKKNDL